MKKRLCVSCRKLLQKGTYWATCEECQEFWIKYWKLDELRKKRKAGATLKELALEKGVFSND